MRLSALCLWFAMAAVGSAQSLDNTFETALGTASLDIQSARYDQGYLKLYRESRYTTMLFEALHPNPWRATYLVSNYRDELTAASDRQSESLAIGAKLLGLNVRRSLLGNPIETATQISKRPGALGAVLQKYREAGLVRASAPSLAGVPQPVQEAAALLLQVALDTAPMRRAAFSQVRDLDGLFKRSREADPDSYSPEDTARDLAENDRVDLKFINAGGQDLAMACSAARAVLLGVADTEKFSWRLQTAWGEVVLSGGTSDSHGEQGAFLILDTGGNDTYVGLPANRSTSNWISIVIDGAGEDSYLSNRSLKSSEVAKDAGRGKGSDFGPGSANLGYTFLYDTRGADLYRSSKPGIASARYGLACLSDSDGDDTYDAYFHGIGAATFGVAVLEDMGGKDLYSGFNSVQGYGGTLGFGAVIDRGGNDRYVANDSVLDFPSPQSAQHNVSLAQGAGYGRRADYQDGHSLSGGVGVLLDLEGDDTYSSGVFGQGVGYWEGCGFLWDRQGNDKYNGQWYVQGASAHFAIGYLEDDNGEDEYTAGMNMAQGAGHDFSTGYLFDRNGNDKYKAPNLSLGAGNANGIGVFMDFSGDDVYDSLGLTLGRGAEAPKGTVREKCLCLGLFYDGAGTDTYPTSANWARNNARNPNWTDRGSSAQESQLGIFWDR